jgi:hypothetical protein
MHVFRQPILLSCCRFEAGSPLIGRSSPNIAKPREPEQQTSLTTTILAPLPAQKASILLDQAETASSVTINNGGKRGTKAEKADKDKHTTQQGGTVEKGEKSSNQLRSRNKQGKAS